MKLQLCTNHVPQHIILHNPIDEHFININSYSWVSAMHPRFILYHNLVWSNLEPWKHATSIVRICNKQCQNLQHRVIPSHQATTHVHFLFPKALPHIRRLFHNKACVYVTYARSPSVSTWMSPLSPVYALVDVLFNLPFSLSLCYGCIVLFTHFCRWPFSS